MHPASAFIKPKYFKTRVKERKARAHRLRERRSLTVKVESASPWYKKECDLAFASCFPRGDVNSTVERNNAADVPGGGGGWRGRGRTVARRWRNISRSLFRQQLRTAAGRSQPACPFPPFPPPSPPLPVPVGCGYMVGRWYLNLRRRVI